MLRGVPGPSAPEDAQPTKPPPDLRMVLLAVAAWTGALTGFLLPPWVNGAAALGLTGWLALIHRGGHRRGSGVVLLAACVAAAAAVACSAMLRVETNQSSPVGELAVEEAYVSAEVKVTSDPALRQGDYEPYVLVRGRVLTVTGRGETSTTHVPLLILADASWESARLGSVVRASGRLSPPEGVQLAAVMSTSRPPVELVAPGTALGGAAHVRAGIRGSVDGLPAAERSLVPALVVGDDQGMPDQVTENFQVSGLTHLLAVSGTNLTLVVGFLLIVARWAGVRARGLIVVGALGVVGFVLLARTEPSVVRAAAMGTVALIGMGSGGREKGVRALGVAVFMLLLYDPWLALSVGFVLSSLATAGILFLAPPWRDAMMRWMPRSAAEAISVPLAAQLACTPVVAAISGQVSLVAVAANMLAAPAVGPATVCGLAGGLAMLVLEPVGQGLGRVAGWCAWWIIGVADYCAQMPSAAVDWRATAVSIAVLSALCLAIALAMPRVLGHRLRCIGTAVLLVTVVVRPVPTFGWPPDDWILVACDVGQGDGLAVRAGPARAVVVDTGEDPALIDRCLSRLGVTAVPVVILSHFHADHVGGLAGVLEDRSVGEIEVTGLAAPEEAAASVATLAAAADVPVATPEYGEQRAVGDVSWQVVGPSRAVSGAGSGEEGGDANNASLTILMETAGVRILLTGDIEPEAQQLLDRTLVDLAVDVLKVPHHGSRYQDADFLSGLGAHVAVISAGESNDYGHPAPETLTLLEDAGMSVHRTDLDGDIAVVVEEQELQVVTSD